MSQRGGTFFCATRYSILLNTREGSVWYVMYISISAPWTPATLPRYSKTPLHSTVCITIKISLSVYAVSMLCGFFSRIFLPALGNTQRNLVPLPWNRWRMNYSGQEIIFFCGTCVLGFPPGFQIANFHPHIFPAV